MLSAGSFHCSKNESADSKKDATNVEEPEYKEMQPLPEADTLFSFPYHLAFYLKDSEVWATDTIAHIDQQLSFTQGNVDTFFVSPTKKYVLCQHITGSVKSPGIFEEGEDPGEEPVYSLMTIRTSDKKILRDFDAPLDLFLYFERWLSESQFLCSTSDGFAVGFFFVYDAYRDSLQRVPYGFGDAK